jgi:hypothetical protein
MSINQKYVDMFQGITDHLTQHEVEEEVKDFIDYEFMIKDETHFDEIYVEFLRRLNTPKT